jgi:2-polyprenyl-3-methyl-5-hydroxy-6-metoxy-1,4-benzoquinol methylase
MGETVTNEHFVPAEGETLEDYLARGEKTPVHHLIRYRWAEQVLRQLRPDSVLDVACGAGYGSYGLASAFEEIEVVGGDYDEVAVLFARDNYQAPNLRFFKVDVTRWGESLGDREFDCVISFDTIEHVEHREIMMQNIVNHLSPDGFLLLSTPVKLENVLNPGWEHHKIEYSKWALHDFLRRYFAEVQAPDFGTLPCVEVFDDLNRDEMIYVLKMNPLVCRSPIRVPRRAVDD